MRHSMLPGLLALPLLAGHAFGQCGPTIAWDHAFGVDGIGYGVTLSSTSGHVTSLAVYDGSLIVAGEFDTAGRGSGGSRVSASNIAAYTESGSCFGVWSALGGGLSFASVSLPFIGDMAVLDDDLFVIGDFRLPAPSGSLVKVARWDGSDWHDADAGLSSAHNVVAIEVTDDRVFLLAYISDCDPSPPFHRAQLFEFIAGAWSDVGLSLNATQPQSAGCLLGTSDGLYIDVFSIGAFACDNGSACEDGYSNVMLMDVSNYSTSSFLDMRWCGTGWCQATPEPHNSGVRQQMAVFDGALYVTGKDHLLRSGCLGQVGTFHVWGGDLTGGTDEWNLVTPLSCINETTSMVVYDDGNGPQLYLGAHGGHTATSTSTCSMTSPGSILRFDGTDLGIVNADAAAGGPLPTASPPSVSPGTFQIRVMQVYNNRLFVGGDFSLINDVSSPGTPSQNIAAFGPYCRADLTHTANSAHANYGIPNGTLNNDDFFYYLDMYTAPNPDVADLTHGAIPGAVGYGVPNGIINSDDFLYYTAIYAETCN